MNPARPSPAFLASVAVVAAGALGYEILLMRLFSVIQWHHFAYMIISLALLGYGASGAFLALGQRYLVSRFAPAYTAGATLFGVSAVGCFLAAQRVPFNALQILWDAREWGRLVVIYLVLLVPFFFAASCMGLALQHYGAYLHRVYALDLLGSGAGAMGVIFLLYAVFPLPALTVLAAATLAAPALAWLGLRRRPAWFAGLFLLAAPLLWWFLQASGAALKPVEYKSLSQALQVVGASRLIERSSPLGLITVVESPMVPFRQVPGLSLNSPAEPPEQLALFTDGDGMSMINRFDGDVAKLAYLDYVPAALGYHLLPAGPDVLVLGAGGGSDVLQALFHRARAIDAVELNPQVAELVQHEYSEFAGHLYEHPRVRLHIEEVRGFAAAAAQRYDLIQLSLLDAFNTSAAGLYALNESYVYTVEALQAYLRDLKPGGYLSISRWVRLPPRDGLKVFATAIEALKGLGVEAPQNRLAWIRSWQTGTLLIKNGDLSAGDIAALKAFCARRSFDIAYAPGVAAEETNRYSVLRQPYFFEAATALLGPGAQDFIDRYKFDIAPAHDDRPYFFQFFKWPLLPEAIALRGAGGLSLLDMGYPVLVATLIQAAVISLLLILLPLTALPGDRGDERARIGRWRIATYFFSVGLAFMFIEIAYIQRFVLYLAHPLHAVAVTLTGFLVFAGLGSLCVSARTRADGHRAIRLAVVLILLLSLLYLALLPPLFAATMGYAKGFKIGLALALMAPVAFCMGMPFPLGLSCLREAAGSIPWAWGINGCASVIAAVLATLIAVHFGQIALLCAALLLYGIASLSCP
jgi:spermidine synthase